MTDCVLVTDQAPPVIKAVEPATGSSLANVHGNLTVVGPQHALVDYGANPQNVDLTLTAVPVPGSANPLSATVSVWPRGEVAIAGTPIRLMFTRSGGLMSVPHAVQYALEGDAAERFAYDGVCDTVVFPAGQSMVTISIPCLVTGDWSVQDGDSETRAESFLFGQRHYIQSGVHRIAQLDSSHFDNHTVLTSGGSLPGRNVVSAVGTNRPATSAPVPNGLLHKLLSDRHAPANSVACSGRL